MTTLKSYLINAVTAGAVALAAVTSGAAPAAADDEDLLRALAGIAAVAVIAGAVQQNNARNRAVQQFRPQYQPQHQPQALQHYSFHDQDQGFYPRERPSRGQRRGPRLPVACALEVGSGGNSDVYYTEDCLRRAGVGYGLPQYCAERVRGQGYDGRVYEAGCLRAAGFRTDRRY